MKPTFALAVAMMIVGHTSAVAADPLCDVVRTFETEPREKPTDLKKRRSIAFYWGIEKDAFWSVGCQHNQEAVSKKTCKWLVNHTNQEFSMQLPLSIMACYGYRAPKGALTDWKGMSGSIILHGGHDDDLVLDLDFGRDKAAIRLSKVNFGVNYGPDENPSIPPWSASASK